MNGGADGTAVASRIRVDFPLDDVDPARELAAIRAGLTATPRRIAPKYFYDDRGSELFERICELPEYYPTRAEAALLAEVAGEVVRETGASALVELGSGAATKTRLLLDAMAAAGSLRLYVPFDVSEGTVHRVAGELVAAYPELAVHAVVGDFMEHLGTIPVADGRLVIFLGGTIGNLDPGEARSFLAALGRQMRPGEPLLLGVDRIKDPDRLVAAYDDSAGVTAEFNLNALRVVNRLTGGDFDPARFRHVARWNAGEHRIEMWLAAREAHRVTLPQIDLVLDLDEGEEILTEISTKYDRALAAELLTDSGFRLRRWYTGDDEMFALCLAERTA